MPSQSCIKEPRDWAHWRPRRRQTAENLQDQRCPRGPVESQENSVKSLKSFFLGSSLVLGGWNNVVVN